MRRRHHDAFGNAKLDGRDEIRLDDLGENAREKQRIGF